MNLLLDTALSNLLVAAVLAVPAALAGWWGRRPALTHGLWLLVLLKLVTPPLLHVPVAWPAPGLPAPVAAEPAPAAVKPPAVLPEAAAAAPPAPIVDEPPALAAADFVPEMPFRDEIPAPAPVPPEAPVDPDPPPVQPADMLAPPEGDESSTAWTTWLALAWLGGSATWTALAALRLNRFRRLLRFGRQAPHEIQLEARTLAEGMGVRCPQVLLLPAAISPMLWVVGRSPRLLLPEGLLGRLSSEQRATLLAHEIAHWQRGDHLVRWLELLAVAFYWWCPLAWWARRQLQQAEEECCDAWVIEVLPHSARAYALALVETIDYLSGAPAVLPPVASGVGHVRLLKRRLTMILRGTTPRSLTRTGLLAVLGLGLLLLPFVPTLAQAPPNQNDQDAIGQRKQDTDPNKFKQAIDLLEQVRAKAVIEQQQAQNQQQVQNDLQRQRAELENKLKEVQHAINQLKAQAARAAEAAPPMGVGVLPPQKAPAGGFYPAPPGPGHVQPPGKPANVEQRLQQVEHKLDALLWEITNLRRDLTKGHQGPGAGAGMPGMMMPGGGGGHQPGKSINVPGVGAPPGGFAPGGGGRPPQKGGQPGFPPGGFFAPMDGIAPGVPLQGPNIPGSDSPNNPLPPGITSPLSEPQSPPPLGNKGQ